MMSYLKLLPSYPRIGCRDVQTFSKSVQEYSDNPLFVQNCLEMFGILLNVSNYGCLCSKTVLLLQNTMHI